MKTDGEWEGREKRRRRAAGVCLSGGAQPPEIGGINATCTGRRPDRPERRALDVRRVYLVAGDENAHAIEVCVLEVDSEDERVLDDLQN
jgi:hypothetical protein